MDRSFGRLFMLFRVVYNRIHLPRFFHSSKTVCNQNKRWNLGKLNHIAIATPNLEKTAKFYCDILGAKISDPLPLPEHGVTTVFVELGNTKIELLHPLGENSPIAKYLEKNKLGGMHHICIEVDDITAAVKELREHNVRCLTEESTIGAHGKPVIFLHPKDCGGVLIELEQA